MHFELIIAKIVMVTSLAIVHYYTQGRFSDVMVKKKDVRPIDQI